MPEKRPHHSHDAPRREGAHRKGPQKGPSQTRGRQVREGGQFNEQRRDVHASRGPRDRLADDRAPRAADAGGFDPAASLHRGQDSRNELARRDRNDRPRFEAPGNEARTGAQRADRAPQARAPRDDGPRHSGDRNDGARRDGARNDGQRREGPRRDGQHHDGQRHEGVRSHAPRGDGPRSEKPHAPRQEGRADHRADRPQRADAKPHGAGERNWNGQKPPKFLGSRGADRPNRKPAA